ncbi:FAS-like protein, partial [Mya arenaria]
PSLTLQGSDAAGCLALEQAYSSLRQGDVECAVVAGASIAFKMAANMWMTEHGLGSDMPKPFDKSASGFIGGDGVVAMVLQCHETAKRVHAIIVNTETQVSRPDET